MGAVYLAYDETLDRPVALKMLSPAMDGISDALRRFSAEAKAIAKLNSPNVVQIYEFQPDPPDPFIAMEYVRGTDLSHYIRDNAPVPLGTVLECARQALTGLAAAHDAGIIHRDIKPANILLSESGVVKLSDFGLVRSMELCNSLTQTGTVLGTLHYMAPEVAQGDTAMARSDLYSLGVTVYEMLTGQVPIDDPSPLRLISRIAHESPPRLEHSRSDLPKSVTAWVAKLMARDPEKRYASAHEALQDHAKLVTESHTQLLTPVLQAEDVVDLPLFTESPTQPTPARGADYQNGEPQELPKAKVRLSAIDAILAHAMRLEREQKKVMSRESFVEIAREVGVDTGMVEQALREHYRPTQTRAVPPDSRMRSGSLAAGAVGVLLAILVAGVGGYAYTQYRAVLAERQKARLHAQMAHDRAEGAESATTPMEESVNEPDRNLTVPLSLAGEPAPSPVQFAVHPSSVTVTSMALSEDGSYLYIANEGQNEVYAWSVDTTKRVKVIACEQPRHLIARRGKLYVASYTEGRIYVYDSAQNWKLIDQLSTGCQRLYYLSAAHGEYFNDTLLATAGSDSFTDRKVSLVSVKTGTHKLLTQSTSMGVVQTLNYRGTRVVIQSHFTHSPSGTVSSISLDELTDSQWHQNQRGDHRNTPFLVQAHDGAMWFGYNGVYAGMPPKSIGDKGWDMIVPDRMLKQFYVVDVQSVTAYGAVPAMPLIASSPASFPDAFPKDKGTYGENRNPFQETPFTFYQNLAATRGKRLHLFIVDAPRRILYHAETLAFASDRPKAKLPGEKQ